MYGEEKAQAAAEPGVQRPELPSTPRFISSVSLLALYLAGEWNMSQQQRAASELLILGLLSAAFLALVPSRPIYVDAALALFGLTLVLLNAPYIRKQMWGRFPVDVAPHSRLHCVFVTTGVTAGVMLLFLLIGIVIGYQEAGWPGTAARILHLNLPLAFFLYLPWAFLQQTLFQFYLLGRLRLLCPTSHPLVPSTLCGLIFGAVHVPDLGIVALTALGGTAWSVLYVRYRRLWPLAVSHALIGTTFYYWVYGIDLAHRWSASLVAPWAGQ